MLSLVRAGLAAALLALALCSGRGRRQGVPAQRSRCSRDQARGANQAGRRQRDQTGRRRCASKPMPPSRSATSAPACWCSARWSRPRPTTRRAGCGWRARSARSARATTAKRRCCSIAPRPPPILPTGARRIARSKATAWRCSAARSPTASSGGPRSTLCGWRCKCTRPPTCAANTNACGSSTASGCSTIRSMPMRLRRAPASSSPKSCPAAAPTSPHSLRSPARTSRRFRQPTNSSASRA